MRADSYGTGLADLLGGDVLSFFQLRVYGDESYAQPGHAGREYSSYPFMIAGYIGTVRIWKRFEREWNRLLKAEQRRNPAFPGFFHMAEVEGGYGAFSYLRGYDGREERDRLQRVFIETIRRFEIYGVAVGIPKGDLARVTAELSRYSYLSPDEVSGVMEPYLFTLECFFNTVCARLRGHEQHQVEFVMDQQQEFAAAAHRVRARLVANPDYSNRDRVGPLTYCSKKLAAPLQAADILAYEIMRENRDAGEKSRWQRTRLDSLDRTIYTEYFDEGLLGGFVERLHATVMTGEDPQRGTR